MPESKLSLSVSELARISAEGQLLNVILGKKRVSRRSYTAAACYQSATKKDSRSHELSKLPDI